MSQSRPVTWLLHDDDSERVSLARLGFLILGPDASPAIPDLARYATNEVCVPLALGAGELLGRLGPGALPALLAIVTNNQSILYRSVAIRSLRELGTDACLAIPVLVQCLTDPSDAVAPFAAEALGTIQEDPETVVPALTACLTRPDVRYAAAEALGEFGAAARAAIPALARLQADITLPDKYAAERAIARITSKVDTHSLPP